MILNYCKKVKGIIDMKLCFLDESSTITISVSYLARVKPA